MMVHGQMSQYATTTPTSLMDLPNELFPPILEHIHARDLESFARINRRVFILSQDALKEHWPLKRDYSQITIKPCQYGQLAHLVAKTVENPLLAFYPEILKVENVYDEWPHRAKGVLPDYPLDVLDNVWQSLYGTVNPSNSSPFGQSIQRGSEQGVLALLLMLLPNLRFLDLDFRLLYNADSMILVQVLDQFLAKKGPKALSNLQTLMVSRYDSSSNLKFFKRVLQIPSLQILRFRGMNDGLNNPDMMNPAPKVSNISTLELVNCMIGPRTLHSILNCMIKLEHFSFEFFTAAGKVKIIPSWLCASLEVRSKQSLVSLKILGCHIAHKGVHEEYYHLGALQAFTVLKHLSINVELLCDYDVSLDTDLSRQLPTSLETITLYADNDWGGPLGHSRAAQILAMSYPTLEKLPLLRAIKFRGFSNESLNYLFRSGLETMMNQHGGVVEWENVSPAGFTWLPT